MPCARHLFHRSSGQTPKLPRLFITKLLGLLGVSTLNALESVGLGAAREVNGMAVGIVVLVHEIAHSPSTEELECQKQSAKVLYTTVVRMKLSVVCV